MRYTRIPESTFQTIQLNAGVVAADFEPSSGELDEEDIFGATTGGTNFTATPSFTDFGEDIDNCPKNTKELAHIDSWEVKLSGTFVTFGTESAKRLMAACDVTEGDPIYALTADTDIVTGKTYYTRSGTSPNYEYSVVATPVKASLNTYYEVVGSTPDTLTPRRDLQPSDFDGIWWVGDYSDRNSAESGGFIAVHMMNSLSTGGFQIQSSDKAKGNFAYEFSAFYSLDAQETVPFEVYISEGIA